MSFDLENSETIHVYQSRPAYLFVTTEKDRELNDPPELLRGGGSVADDALPLLEEEAPDDTEGEEEDGHADAGRGIVILYVTATVGTV